MEYSLSTIELYKVQSRVIVSLMLRGMRSRFFGHGAGFFLASVLWPLAHIAVLLVLYTAVGRTTPYGNSLILFLATGLVPFMTFNYISRQIMIGVVLDRPLLTFTIVKLSDMLISRVLLEILGSFASIVTLAFVLWCLGVNFVPRDTVQAACAYGACILFGAGMGLINTVIVQSFRLWFTGYLLIIIALYASSGILFVINSLPTKAAYYLSFNPVGQGVEWLRSCYYPGYGAATLDKNYLLAWGLCTLFFGLLLERMFRGRAMMR